MATSTQTCDQVSGQRVVVLMSTYQGEQFVAAQIRSILDQLPSNGRLLIRDDGSRDATVEILESIRDSRISVTVGANIGFARSFMALIQAVPEDADVVMVSDQDDIWLHGKIERATRYLHGRDEVPALYCSRLQMVDRELKPLQQSLQWPLGPSFQNALAENIVIGCTAAFNRAALRLIQRQGDVRLIYFHDWWLYIVVSAFGVVHADPEPTVLYRQHGGNAIGMGSGVRDLVGKLRHVRNSDWVHGMFSQIENFKSVFLGELSKEQVWLLDRYFDRRKPGDADREFFNNSLRDLNGNTLNATSMAREVVGNDNNLVRKRSRHDRNDSCSVR